MRPRWIPIRIKRRLTRGVTVCASLLRRDPGIVTAFEGSIVTSLSNSTFFCLVMSLFFDVKIQELIFVRYLGSGVRYGRVINTASYLKVVTYLSSLDRRHGMVAWC